MKNLIVMPASFAWSLVSTTAGWLQCRFESKDALSIPTMLFIYGMSLFPLSLIFNLADVKHVAAPGVVKNVGYVGSLNWSVVLPVLIPVIAFFTIFLLLEMNRLLAEWIDAGMIVGSTRTADGQSVERARATWSKFKQGAFVAGVLLGTSMGLASIAEWWLRSGSLLLVSPDKVLEDAQLPAAQAQLRHDWAVAAAEAPRRGGLIGNACFSLLAFLGQAAGLGVAYLFLALSIAIALFFLDLSTGWWSQARLIPNLCEKSPATIGGLRQIQVVGGLLILNSVLCYLSVYLILLASQFEHSTDFASMFDMLTSPIRAWDGWEAVQSSIWSFFSSVSILDYSAASSLCWGIIIILVIFWGIACALIPFVIYRSIEWARTLIDSQRFLAPPAANSTDPEKLRKRLTNIRQIWPYALFNPGQGVLYGSLLLVGLMYFRLLPMLFSIIVVVTVRRFIAELQRQATEPEPNGANGLPQK